MHNNVRPVAEDGSRLNGSAPEPGAMMGWSMALRGSVSRQPVLVPALHGSAAHVTVWSGRTVAQLSSLRTWASQQTPAYGRRATPACQVASPVLEEPSPTQTKVARSSSPQSLYY